MRVAIFTDTDLANVNGVTTTLAAALHHAPADLKLRIYAASEDAVDTPAYFALRSFGAPMPFYRAMKLYAPRIGAYLRRAKADGVDVIHLTTPGPMGFAAMRIARALRIPMVGSVHADVAAHARALSGSAALGAAVRGFTRWPYGRCARVLVPSDGARRVLDQAQNDPRLEVWPRGVDADAFCPARRSAALRESWKAGPDCPVILYVGRVSLEKGLGVLPAIQMRLRILGVRHRLVVAGDGPMLAPLRERLSDAVFTGALSRAEVAKAYASADVCLLPSRMDSTGSAVLEAQASGVPVLVAHTGGAREHMLPGRSGLVIPGADPDDWVRGLGPLLRDAPQRLRMGDAGRIYAGSRTWTEALAPLYRAYREVVGAFVARRATLVAVAHERAS